MPGLNLPEVVIIGRPNVGKSTLFNRILGRRQAIVGKQSGLTRDRHTAAAEWCGRHFQVSDTGGVEWESADELLRQIQTHALGAVERAAAVLLVVDAREGLVAIEAQLAQELRRRDLPLLLVVNKCDHEARATDQAAEFHALGIGPLHAISAEQGTGVADLLDDLLTVLPEVTDEPDDLPEGTVRVAVVGRPNVGKSSLVNAMLGTERVIVSEVSGTTRDPIDTLMERGGRSYLLIDTAGIRRGAKRQTFAENVSVSIARRRMQRADVALLVIDAVIGLSRQDVSIAAEAGVAGCGLIVVVNKWDLIEARQGVTRQWEAELRKRMGRIGFARFAYVSALHGSGVERLFPLIDEVATNRSRRVPTAELNALFDRLSRRGPQGPPGSPTLRYTTQAAVDPPTFIVFVSGGNREMPASFTRFLENRLRSEFDLTGTPVRLHVRRQRRS